jgi:signal transduction histidine kinase
VTGSQRSRRQVALAWPVMALQEKNQQRITLVIHDDGVGFDVPAHIAFD